MQGKNNLTRSSRGRMQYVARLTQINSNISSSGKRCNVSGPRWEIHIILNWLRFTKVWLNLMQGRVCCRNPPAADTCKLRVGNLDHRADRKVERLRSGPLCSPSLHPGGLGRQGMAEGNFVTR
jgi:hypothetical protein